MTGIPKELPEFSTRKSLGIPNKKYLILMHLKISVLWLMTPVYFQKLIFKIGGVSSYYISETSWQM